MERTSANTSLFHASTRNIVYICMSIYTEALTDLKMWTSPYREGYKTSSDDVMIMTLDQNGMIVTFDYCVNTPDNGFESKLFMKVDKQVEWFFETVLRSVFICLFLFIAKGRIYQTLIAYSILFLQIFSLWMNTWTYWRAGSAGWPIRSSSSICVNSFQHGGSGGWIRERPRTVGSVP